MRATAVMIGAFAITALGAGTASADRCIGAKLSAIGKKERGLLACQARVAVQGKRPEAACDGRAISAFEGRYDRPGACGAPASSVCETIADDCRDQVRAALPDGAPSRCEAARLRAAGRKAAAKLGCYAKAAARGIPVDSRCLTRGSATFATAFNQLNGCTGDGQAAAIELLIDSECVDQLVTVDRTGRVTAICPTTATTTTAAPTTTTTTTTTTTSQAQTTTTATSLTTTTTLASCGTSPQQCHDVCTVGAPECSSCSDCAAKVCAQNTNCCDPTRTWDALCVSQVNTFCCPSDGVCCP